MSKPYIHAKSSARRFGGVMADYEEIHTFLDSSKSSFPSNLHRCITHNSFFIFNVLERIKFHNSGPCAPDNRFPLIINSDGKEVSVREIGEMHILEDFRGRFIPSVADYLNNMEMQPWMNGGPGVPPSFEKIYNKKKKQEPIAPIVYDGSNKLNPPFQRLDHSIVLDGPKPDGWHERLLNMAVKETSAAEDSPTLTKEVLSNLKD